MAFRPRRWLADAVRGRAATHWAAIAASTDRMSNGRLRAIQADALGLRASLDRFLSRAQFRLEGLGRAMDVLNLPPGTDWRWRPSFLSDRITPAGIAAPGNGQHLGDEAAVWHDCPSQALILRQMPNRNAADLAPHGLQLETLGFGGSYLSVAINLPPDSLDNLTRSHIIRLDATLSVERPMSIYARLNIGHGPNTDELLRHLGDLVPGDVLTRAIEFDLHYLEINEKRLERMWLDLIFETPQMNSVRIRDLFFSRHLRADM
ncbi:MULTISPECIES: DUF6478 family protein [unclassified Paracoccus (in: a-proteobacteria)]|uniref:DUF6478 family protein n=1 Tax=unclassified Paracoccus (in: a-proteobacteria) TaxID=2688777 RepID=UPI0016034501|nr:DUF6478 family protein [Paracoccus sp. MC1862]MBB1490743.1 hypothetical protein [Paracoccus sp. MC1854]MBB1497414.1 hypothetical protein [Paracoccus sp. MC1862]QQO45902.1 hypothetical protein JGR78_06270 [Paracoccus sp. MC1862]